jgi:hypothetical protein
MGLFKQNRVIMVYEDVSQFKKAAFIQCPKKVENWWKITGNGESEKSTELTVCCSGRLELITHAPWPFYMADICLLF